MVPTAVAGLPDVPGLKTHVFKFDGLVFLT